MNFLCSSLIGLLVPWNHSFIHARIYPSRCSLPNNHPLQIARLSGTSTAAANTCPALRNPQSCLGRRWALDSVQSKINLSWDIYKWSWNRLSLLMLFDWLCFYFLCEYVSIEVVSKHLPLSKQDREERLNKISFKKAQHLWFLPLCVSLLSLHCLIFKQPL